ncbi:MAG: PD-(D/E)XK nuclease family protein [bacterium]
MPIQKALSIEELSRRVQGYDRVITQEAPLADAINSRIHTARLDHATYTPRGIVYLKYVEGDTRDRRDLYLELIKHTDFGKKRALYLLENVLDCWQETGDPQKILQYDEFDNDDIRRVLQFLNETTSVFQRMSEHTWSESMDTAVLAPHQFTPLDRQVLPPGYDTINVFHEGSRYELPEFLRYTSATGLVQSILDNINEGNVHDTAIVMDQRSHYQSLVESAFQAEEIPYITSSTLTEDLDFRTLFRLMRSAFTRNRLRLRDIRPVLHRMNRPVSIRDEARFLHEVKGELLETFREFVREIPRTRFASVLDWYEEQLDLNVQSGDPIALLRGVLGDLGYLDQTVNRRRLNHVEFYLGTFDQQLDNDQNQGVLLVDPLSGAYVDRSIVYYVGLDSEWTRQIPETPWADKDFHRQRNLTDFQLLLQNGEQRYMLVQDTMMNRSVNPCYYFNVLLDDPLETFSEGPSRKMQSRSLEPSASVGFDKESVDVPIEPVEALSQSSLKSLVRCPREYLFSKLIPTSENRYLLRGNLFHDFAELYTNHPQWVKEEGVDRCLEIMVERMSPFEDEWTREQEATEFEIGMENIMEYIDEWGYRDEPYPDYRPRSNENVLAEELNLEISRPITEAWFENKQVGVRGKIDLVRNPEELVDYKSGSSRSVRSIVKQSNVELIKDDPDFQAILYLAQHRQVYPDRPLRFTFFHFLDNVKDHLRGEDRLEDCLVTVTYFPRTFSDQVPRQETIDYLIEGLSEGNARRKTIEGMGVEAYSEFFRENPLPEEYDRDKLLASDYTDSFEEFCVSRFKDAKYVRQGARQILKQLTYFRREHYFKEDIDRFEKFLQDHLQKISQYNENRFPVKGDLEKFDLDDVEYRDLIVEET